MANKEHLDILKQGVQVWNDWRKANPKIKPVGYPLDSGDPKM